VMAMGRSWALRFCQEMMAASVQKVGTPKVGTPTSQCFRDKGPAPDLTDAQVAAAVYVDSAAITSTDEKRVTATADAVFRQLEADGSDCKTIEHGPDLAHFTGLDLHRASGRISVGHSRCWKVRLALSHVSAVGRASGPEIHSLLWHCTWSAILRRCVPSLPRACYRFVDMAGLGRVPLCAPGLANYMTTTDSEGANLIDNGGFGVVRKFLGAEQARAAALAAAASPGATAAGADAEATASSDLGVTFNHLDRSVIGDFSSWQLRVNPADGPSRLKGPVARSGGAGPRDARAVEALARDELRSGGATGAAAASWWAPPAPLVITGADGTIGDWRSAASSADSSSSSDSEGACSEAVASALPSAQQRRARARRRVEVHRAHASSRRDLGAYFLEVNRVARNSATLRDRCFSDFRKWAALAGMPLSTPAEIDFALVGHLEDLYFSGFNHDAGKKVVTSVEFRIPELKIPGRTVLPRAKDAMRGFRRLAPGRTFTPPSAGGQAVPPHPGTDAASWALLLAPAELSVASKTHEFDESLLLDNVEFCPLQDFFHRAKAAPRTRPLWSFDSVTFSRNFAQLVELADLSNLRPHPCMPRRGGASDDALRNAGALEEMKRGRWRADSSVRRYEKPARALKQADNMTVAAREHGLLVGNRLLEIPAGLRACPQPPNTRAVQLTQ
ncbi:unnamed protein product, partial [Prorocentrum cordatum]